MYIILSLAFKGQNYGQLLQAYATQVVLDRMGCRTQIIDYHRSGFDGIRPTPWLACYGAARLARKLKGKKARIEMDETHRHNIEARRCSAETFRHTRLHDVIRIDGIRALNELGRSCDAAMVGSDQCWLPESCFGNLRTLRFVPDGVRKISYATSLGVSSYPVYCRSSARQFLRRFDFISVREEQGKRIVESLCDKKAEVVLDPTYLLTREDWLELIPDGREIVGPYILGFFIGDNPRSKRAAVDFAQRARIKLVSILSDESCSELDLTYADEVIAGAGP
ncbi:MAG: polysaccharide pyruvyl transferase family protein, partial [Eubacteriales bacterium]|nr:polysaccharide pyruvyl transferase family protein [Eubacteriales bacterium]